MDADRYFDSVRKLASLLNLTDDAISVAKGWSILPEPARRHVGQLINEYVTGMSPTLRALYSNARHADQLRFERDTVRRSKLPRR